METLRTPDERYADLPDVPFKPNYVEIDDGDGGELRVHYLDEGPADAPPVLVMHGEPSWCFLYRTMIPVLTAAGNRVVAPDLVGFGRSDKPAARTDYTYQRHVDWMRRALIDSLDLRDATFVGQDWGGLIGLRLVAEHPDRFSRAVAANTMLPTGDHDPGPAFLAWQKYSQETPTFHVGGIVKGGTTTEMSDAVVAAYDAPFPDESYKEGARQFPLLVPTSPDDPAADANRAAWDVLREWKKPFLTAFSDSDAITRGGERVFQSIVPGAADRDHPTIVGGGHFLQEDCGPELARVVAEFISTT
jgi:haloalkane dehalogenase